MPLNELQVCVECGKEDAPENQQCVGEQLCTLAEELLTVVPLNEHFKVRPVACLGNCDRRGRLVVASQNKWSWTIGDIHPDTDRAFLSEFLNQWAANSTGLIPKKQRSQDLMDKALGRQPPLLRGPS
ncbi:MAG: DUF1636 family protein [Pseudomonadota bacterium]